MCWRRFGLLAALTGALWGVTAFLSSVIGGLLFGEAVVGLESGIESNLFPFLIGGVVASFLAWGILMFLQTQRRLGGDNTRALVATLIVWLPLIGGGAALSIIFPTRYELNEVELAKGVITIAIFALILAGIKRRFGRRRIPLNS